MPPQVILNPAALARLLRSESGPVYRDLLRRGDLVKREAQRLAPVGESSPGRSRAPGTLRNSIVKRVVSRGSSFVVQVGTDDPVGRYVHEGTQPHLIQGNPFLVFFWPKAGQVVYLRQVNHPGTPRNPFLVDALRAAGR